MCVLKKCMTVPTRSSEEVLSPIQGSSPEELTFPIRSLDHCDHVVNTSLAGHPELAADHFLNVEMVGKLVGCVGSVIRQLNLEFLKSRVAPDDPAEVRTRKIQARRRSYDVLIEIALNAVGVEGRRVGFSEEETDQTIRQVVNALERWEELEATEEPRSGSPIASTVVERILEGMRVVAGGRSMVAHMAKEIEDQLVDGRLASSLVQTAKKVIRENIYYEMTVEGLCKFGNDYAIGLRWLRHLGFVQVSTNPVLAARAYNDDPRLWDDFRNVAKAHPEWSQDPEGFGDEIAMGATMVALWPNMIVFRPIALISGMHDGMVSYQLNPRVATSLEGSITDALKIYSQATEFIRDYDSYLAWGYLNKRDSGRPNIVFKVAAESPVACDITTALNGMGIGTNNTVTFTVAQEVALMMAAIRGMGKAKRMGIPPTQIYETNMGGRLESHLREVEAERILLETLDGSNNKEMSLRKLAQGLGAPVEPDKTQSLVEKVKTVCSSKYLKSLTDRTFSETVALGYRQAPSEGKGGRAISLAQLAETEEVIGYAGTVVAQKVYGIFFSPENRAKWIAYVRKQFDLSKSEAEEVMDKIDVLPASKRKPDDTYLTLARRNVTNTEFPNHQLDVLLASRRPGFDIHRFEDSIAKRHARNVLERLLKLEDFRRAYELTPELVGELQRVGIDAESGERPLRSEEWSGFGPVVKTMTEFRNAYSSFRKASTGIASESATRRSP